MKTRINRLPKVPEIPDYKIETVLGRGGMAYVYRARHLRLDRLVALKVMHGDLSDRDSQFSKRFLREAQISADLTHPHIVHVYDVNKFEKLHYIAMEYVDGGDLHDRLKDYISHEELLTIIEQISSALDFAHSKGYVHRDIKPANILFRDNGEVLVSDFGIAKALNSNTQMTELGSVLGTPTYMSPEQAGGKDVDGRSDLYSVVVMIYQILTGKPPYTGNTSLTIAVKHVNDPIPLLPESLKAMQTFIDKGMAKDPSDRFSNGKELMLMLRECISALEPEDVLATETLVIGNLAEYALTEVTDRSSSIEENTDGESSHPSGQHDSRITTGPSITIQLPNKIWPGVVFLGVLIVGAFGWSFLSSKDSSKEISQQASYPISQQSGSASQSTSHDYKARVDILLNLSQKDIAAGRVTKPEANNAFDKILQATAIDPKYEATQQAVEQLISLLFEQSEKAIQAKNWVVARQYIIRALKLQSDNEIARQQLAVIDAAEKYETAKREELLQAARVAVKQEHWSQAVNNFHALQKMAPLDVAVQQEVAEIGNRFVQQGKSQTAQMQFNNASATLKIAKQFVPLGEQSALASAIKKAEKANHQKRDNVNFKNRVDSLLRQASSSGDPKKKLALYSQVLNLVPNSSQAHKGVEDNVSASLVAAGSAINNGKLDKSNSLLDTVKKSSRVVALTKKQQRQLASLRKELKVSKSKKARIDKLFNRFDRYMQAPKVSSALKIYERILEDTTSDKRLPGIRERLVDTYLKLAEEEIADRDLRGARGYVKKGLGVSPNHKALKALQQRIAK